MQTFLPYANFEKSAKVLDRQRLGKQRVETMQIMQVLLNPLAKKGWKNHPAVKMWQGHELTLLEYQSAICAEWKSRGYKDTCEEKTVDICFRHFASYTVPLKQPKPSWLGDEKFHASHRSNLLRKNAIWYNRYQWKEPDDLLYVWPSRLVPLQVSHV